MEFKFIWTEKKELRVNSPVYYENKVVGEITKVKVGKENSIITIEVPSSTLFFVPGTVSLTCKYDICRLKKIR